VKRLGILGGMGPEAAIDLQAKILRLTPATNDQAHLPVVVWNVPQIPDRTAAIIGNGESPVDAMDQGIQALGKMGAQRIVIACNTAHHWHGALQNKTAIPILHIADAVHVTLSASAEPIRCVGLMATLGTVSSGFYAARLASLGVELIVPGSGAQQALSTAIGLLKSGQHDAAATIVDQVAQELLDLGAQRLILGCTELPLVAEKLSTQHLCIDATVALAKAAVSECLD
jgi:aspartate racemase